MKMKKVIILVIFILCILLIMCFVYNKNDFLIYNETTDAVVNSNENIIEKKIIDENIENKYINIINNSGIDNKIILSINDNEFSQKDYEIFKYYHSQLEDETMLDEFIKDELLYNVAKQSQVQISEENQEYIDDIIKDYKKSEEELINLGVDDVDKYINKIKQQLEKIALVTEFKYYIIAQIKNGNFNTTSDSINEKCKKYNELNRKFKEQSDDNINIEDLVSLRNEIIEDYILLLKEESNMKIYEV